MALVVYQQLLYHVTIKMNVNKLVEILNFIVDKNITDHSIFCHWSLSMPLWKDQKTSGFRMFSGDMERVQWYEMG